MLMMLIYELYYFIDNRKDTINKKDLFTICNNIMIADLDNFKELSIQEHPKFIVNDNYCIKYGVNRNTAKNIAKKQITYNEIGNLYDCQLSDKENIRIMKEFGLSISQQTLTRIKQENGLTRNYNKKEITHSEYIIKKEENIITSERVIEEENKNIELTNNIEEIEDDITIYNNQYPDYVNQFITNHCNNIIDEIITTIKKNKMTNEERTKQIDKLVNNVNVLLNKLKQVNDIQEIETKYDLLNDYISNQAKLISDFDPTKLFRETNVRYLKIKDSKNMDYRFDEYCFTTYQYVA